MEFIPCLEVEEEFPIKERPLPVQQNLDDSHPISSKSSKSSSDSIVHLKPAFFKLDESVHEESQNIRGSYEQPLISEPSINLQTESSQIISKINNLLNADSFLSKSTIPMQSPHTLSVSPEFEKYLPPQQIQRVPYLFIDVKVNDEELHTISVFEGDKPEELARRFGERYGIDQQTQEVLLKMIRNQMNGVLSRIEEVESEVTEQSRD